MDDGPIGTAVGTTLSPRIARANHLQRFADAAGVDVHAIDRGMRRIDRVFQPDLQRIQTQFLRHHFHQDFHGEARVRGPVAAHRGARRMVGENAVGVVLVIRETVGQRRVNAAQVQRERSDHRVGAAFCVSGALQRGDRTVLLHAHLADDRKVVAPTAGREHLFHGVLEFHRLAGHFREQHGAEIARDRIILGAAETAADERLDDADLRQRQVEAGGEVPVMKVGALLCRPHRDAIGIP